MITECNQLISPQLQSVLGMHDLQQYLIKSIDIKPSLTLESVKSLISFEIENGYIKASDNAEAVYIDILANRPNKSAGLTGLLYT